MSVLSMKCSVVLRFEQVFDVEVRLYAFLFLFPLGRVVVHLFLFAGAALLRRGGNFPDPLVLGVARDGADGLSARLLLEALRLLGPPVFQKRYLGETERVL